MHEEPIEPAYSQWAVLNQRLVAAVQTLGDEDLALSAGSGRWPI